MTCERVEKNAADAAKRLLKISAAPAPDVIETCIDEPVSTTRKRSAPAFHDPSVAQMDSTARNAQRRKDIKAGTATRITQRPGRNQARPDSDFKYTEVSISQVMRMLGLII